MTDPAKPAEPLPATASASPSGSAADATSAPAPAAPAPGSEDAWKPLQFTGTGEEYFRIWVVNVLLTVVTLGIYSAWAKVRRLQYLYRNTRLDGAAFHYHGNPVAILRGRVLAVVLLVLYQYAFEFSAALGVAVMVLLVLALPWLFTRSLHFRLANTSHRGIRFRFHAGAREGYGVFAPPVAIYVAPAVAVGVAGATTGSAAVAGVLSAAGSVLLPWFHARLRRFQANGAAWGRSRARASIPTGDFYGIWLASGIVTMVTSIVAVIAMAIGAIPVTAIMTQIGIETPDKDSLFWILVVILWAWLTMAGPAAYVTGKVQNLVWPATKMDQVAFRSEASSYEMIKIAMTNALLTAITLGLYRPFAVIRMARYRLSVVSVDATALASIVAAAGGGDDDASGEGAADLFDVDLAL